MEEIVNKIKQIKRVEMSERKFYEEILDILKEIPENMKEYTPEAYEKIRSALIEIGCTTFDEWSKQREEIGKPAKQKFKMSKADIEIAVSYVSYFIKDYDGSMLTLDYAFDGGERYGKGQHWLRNSKKITPDKQHIPYYRAAKQALMNWNGLSEEEAAKILETQTFDEVESQVDSKSSMEHAAEGIIKSIQERTTYKLYDDEHEKLLDYIYDGVESPLLDDLQFMASNPYHLKEGQIPGEVINEVIMDTLFAVHDGWVGDKQKKFMAREKKHQHMPSELIGWEELKSDLIFVRPIFENSGIEINEEELEKVYNKRVKEFFLDNDIRTEEDLNEKLPYICLRYAPIVANYGYEFFENIRSDEELRKKVVDQIQEKGIGDIAEKRQEIISEIAENPTKEDISRLDSEEKNQVVSILGMEAEEFKRQGDELADKNEIVERIMTLAKERKALQNAISVEEQKKEDNVQGIQDIDQ